MTAMTLGGVVKDDGAQRAALKPRSPGFRLSENFFQRWLFILLPIVLLSGVGVMLSRTVTPSYSASATLSTAANPLVGTTEVRGASLRFFESPGQATSRLMTEQLGTNQFASMVAERAGLAEAVENGFLLYDDLRDQISVAAQGESLVNIQVMWSDPETSLLLVDAVIGSYQSHLRSTINDDSATAVAFYEERREAAVVLLQLAEADLDVFGDEQPVFWTPDDLSLADSLRLDRLNSRLTAAQESIDEAGALIEEALLSRAQAESEAGRIIQIVDAPSSTFEPESTLRAQIIILFVFAMLGFLIAVTMLVLSTTLDKSIRSTGDIEAAGAGSTVVTVPMIRALRRRRGLGRLIDAVVLRLARGPKRRVGLST